MRSPYLKDFIKKCGGVTKVSQQINISTRAIYKWIKKNSLPRTEYSDETNYANKLSALSGVPAEDIRNMFKPKTKDSAC